VQAEKSWKASSCAAVGAVGVGMHFWCRLRVFDALCDAEGGRVDGRA
jgi:hypothetical protein